MTDHRPEPRTEAGRRMLRRRSYWSGNDDIRAAILAIEAEAAQGAAPLDDECALCHHHRAVHEGSEYPPNAPTACIRCGCPAFMAHVGAAPRAEGLDPHRLGGLIERAIRDSKRQSGGLLPDGWTLVEMALAYPPETPTEPSQSIPSEQEQSDE